IANGTGGFDVVGSHTYAEEGTYTVGVTVTDVGGSSASANSTATVADAALTATGETVTATEGAGFTGTVASFTDADLNGTLTDYTASIDWGDGITTSGVVSDNGNGSFGVSGSHSYAEEGSYPVSVRVNDVGGASATASSTATVADAALTATGTTLAATEGAGFS